jgi:acyl-coenzyme A synthetase/AMP-(fatty) acid ligase
LSFREHILKSFRSTPDEVFQISDDEDTKLTFKQTELFSIRVAQNLKKFGVEKDDVVAVLLHNSTYAAPLVFGCFLNGTAVNPLLFRQGISVEGLTQSLNITRPKVLILEEFVEHTQIIIQTIAEIGLDCKIFTVKADKKILGGNVYDVSELLKETNEEKEFGEV